MFYFKICTQHYWAENVQYEMMISDHYKYCQVDDLCHRLTVTSLPRLASANTFLIPSLLPTSQILASTGWLVIGQSPTCSSYQIVLKMKIFVYENYSFKATFTLKYSINYVVCLSITNHSINQSINQYPNA